MQTTLPPLTEDPTEELDALIEEARRRARRRRFAMSGAVLAAGGALAGGVLFFGGDGGGGGSSGGPGAGGSNQGAGPSQLSTTGTSNGYRCPTSRRQLRELPPPGPAIPGCKVSLLSELPDGWEQAPTSVVTFPVHTIGFLSPQQIRFANFGLPSATRHPVRPFMRAIPPDGMLLNVQAASSRLEEVPTSVSFERTDFKTLPRRPQPFAHADLRLDGVEFQVEAVAGREPIDHGTLEAMNAILAGLDTSQRLCPCGEHINLPGATLKEIDRLPRLHGQPDAGSIDAPGS